MFHLSIRVAWHDNRWNGAVCQNPKANSYCTQLERVRKEKQDDFENDLSATSWSELNPTQLPPCIAEAGGFMNPKEWVRVFIHPYQDIKAAAETHGSLKPTPVKIPPYSTLAVPFWWMLKGNQEVIGNTTASLLPIDQPAPFNTPWVFGRERQMQLNNLFFERLTAKRSLAFFYTKEGHPLGESIPRLIVGVGRIESLSDQLTYKADVRETYPLWERVVRHSIRPDSIEGFLLPYHDYLEPTGDEEEDLRRLQLLQEIAVVADEDHIRDFSYAAELVEADVALATLVRCLEAVRRIREHGIAEGPWGKREEWLNAQIAAAWKDRGPFPGLGSVLEAIGMRLGTALSLELLASGKLVSDSDPWPIVDAVLREEDTPPQNVYKADIHSVRNTWISLSDERRSLLKLLSRFALSPGQAARWFNPEKRSKYTETPVTDEEILNNPYRIAETDLGDWDEPAVSIAVIDRGLLADSTLLAKHPVPEPSAVTSPSDARRVRAGIVTVLRAACAQGDTLLSVNEVLERLGSLSLTRELEISSDWILAHVANMAGVIEVIDIPVGDNGDRVACLQLSVLKAREDNLSKILRARALRPLPSLGVDWRQRLLAAIQETGTIVDKSNSRHMAAMEEQAKALEGLTKRKLAVLVGKAGTGKTSVLGALLQCEALVQDGILLLAPTGKARVRLGKATGSEAMTIAQFLYKAGRYDGYRQRPLFNNKDKYRKEKTIVIDECSMLTLDDIAAVFDALDLAHVQRIILVGDPNQLPPIGAGRPFADFIAYLIGCSNSTDTTQQTSGQALCRLTVEVRTTAGGPSDTLRLATWFTREDQPSGTDLVLSDLQNGLEFNDLHISFWKTESDLQNKLLEQMQKYMGLIGPNDVDGFNKALGFNEKGFIPFEKPDGAEEFQILSPVRLHPYGIKAINRWIQQQFRQRELDEARSKSWKISLGDDEIVPKDKVIQVRNEWRQGYDRQAVDVYLANGEVGIAAFERKGWMNVVFAGRPGLTIGYSGRDFGDGGGPLELAYALTVHKAQGSEFGTVFVIIPKNTRLLSTELIYTALTRAKNRLVLLIEDDNSSVLYDLSRPENSDTARRNTNLFHGTVRERIDSIPYSDHLIHRAAKGHMVRSKSELVISNMLFQMGIKYEYERPYQGSILHGTVLPDFSFVDPAGDVIIWEHLGMLSREDYRQSWERKKAWYEQNGFIMGTNLFTTADDDRGGLNSDEVRDIAQQINSLL
ncbi:AAA family ATPase [Alicyclobacillus tolerans]|uniref:AAA family ATPase n=1 Tax=Alicyclobacillus tolerans TaxID=90970 RepID=UPI001F1A6A2C|nr:AAA family ATPase [Alicyclobacillus tolerans]MCF8567818.1 AAA family ATPase [Alicyclobacillus tolerans]